MGRAALLSLVVCENGPTLNASNSPADKCWRAQNISKKDHIFFGCLLNLHARNTAASEQDHAKLEIFALGALLNGNVPNLTTALGGRVMGPPFHTPH